MFLQERSKVFKLEQKDMNKKIMLSNLKIGIFVIFIIFEIVLVMSFLLKNNLIDVNKDKEAIGVINFNKTITTETVSEAMDLLEEAKKNKNIKEILFIMNSPGGSPSASEELSEYLKELNKDKKITMYVESVAASGGYYIASAIKPLKANKNAIVGSIGVIIQHYNIEELSKKVGVQEDNVAYGEFKQPISFFKPVDEKSKKYLEDNLLRPMYNNFVNSVVENRGVKKEDILKLSEGQIFLANDERVKNILVDEITNLYKVKESFQNKFGKDIIFKELEPEKNKLKELIKGNLDINLNSSTLNTNLQNIIK